MFLFKDEEITFKEGALIGQLTTCHSLTSFRFKCLINVIFIWRLWLFLPYFIRLVKLLLHWIQNWNCELICSQTFFLWKVLSVYDRKWPNTWHKLVIIVFCIFNFCDAILCCALLICVRVSPFLCRRTAFFPQYQSVCS